MNCPGCHLVNAPTDAACIRCGRSLELPKVEALWVYFFVAVCGAIPVLAVCGSVPIFLGLGGASACLAVSRVKALPTVVQMFVCVVITIVVWTVFWVLLGHLLVRAYKKFILP